MPLDTSPFEVEESEAGALFAARAREARPSFTVTTENASAIAELCARLDANALAIELAAARTTVMSPSEILERLEQRFRMLAVRGRDAAERHQTLHAAIDWSYDLLDADEQALLQRLSVFVGDFDLAAATAMAADAGLDEFDAVDRLGSLIAKSLVELSDTTTVSRYRLLETIREYAAEQLYRARTRTRARDAHASHYLAIGRELFAMLATPRDFEALEQLRIDTRTSPLACAGRSTAIGSPTSSRSSPTPGGSTVASRCFVLLYEFGAIGVEAFSREGIEEMRGIRMCCAMRLGERSVTVTSSAFGRW